jgi:hypothetical protein
VARSRSGVLADLSGPGLGAEPRGGLRTVGRQARGAPGGGFASPLPRIAGNGDGFSSIVRQHDDGRMGLLHEQVTSDLWCREVPLEGC